MLQKNDNTAAGLFALFFCLAIMLVAYFYDSIVGLSK